MHVSAIQRVPKESVDPRIKHYHWLDFQMALMEGYDRGADTCAVVDRDGNIAEGPGFNIFAVKDGVVVNAARGRVPRRHDARHGVHACRARPISRCASRRLTPDAMRMADEVFISTTGGGIIPITTVDGQADRVRSARSRHPQAR